MTSKILVAGGTGVVGSFVVQHARLHGYEVVVASRSSGIDLTTGNGLATLVEGCDMVIDVTSSTSVRKRLATEFFTSVTRNLLVACATANVRHFVSLSIVGIDKVPFYGYYQAKLAQEALVHASLVPSSIVRATQFHEFAGQIISRSRLGPSAVVPKMLVQSIAASSVAEKLIDVAKGAVLDCTLNIAGPDTALLSDQARQLVKHHGSSLTIVPLPVPGRLGQAVRAGALLATSSTEILGPSFAGWLGSSSAP